MMPTIRPLSVMPQRALNCLFQRFAVQRAKALVDKHAVKLDSAGR
jgi:hypothetical protein